MTKNTVNETERMVVTRVFDAPRELVWKAWTDPKYAMQWWGPKGFTAPFCEMDFRVGGKFLYCMRAPDGQEFWNGCESTSKNRSKKRANPMRSCCSCVHIILPNLLGSTNGIGSMDKLLLRYRFAGRTA
jgi:hypothetical protein